jgi:hypothetical protein
VRQYHPESGISDFLDQGHGKAWGLPLQKRKAGAVMRYYGYMMDPQQMQPAGWCPVCGMEIWTEGKNLCTRCERYGHRQEVEENV